MQRGPGEQSPTVDMDGGCPDGSSLSEGNMNLGKSAEVGENPHPMDIDEEGEQAVKEGNHVKEGVHSG
jgi:hypothetical protein